MKFLQQISNPKCQTTHISVQDNRREYSIPDLFNKVIKLNSYFTFRLIKADVQVVHVAVSSVHSQRLAYSVSWQCQMPLPLHVLQSVMDYDTGQSTQVNIHIIRCKKPGCAAYRIFLFRKQHNFLKYGWAVFDLNIWEDKKFIFFEFNGTVLKLVAIKIGRLDI